MISATASKAIRSTIATLLFVSVGLSGCSQQDGGELSKHGAIPIDGSRWYIVSNTGADMSLLFDGVLHQSIKTGQGRLIDNYEAWYPLLPGEKMSIDSIALYDDDGTNDQRPTKIFVITGNWERIAVGDFVSTRAHKWVGPYPANPSTFKLATPMNDVRYLVVSTSGNLPSEMMFYGGYTAPTKMAPAKVVHQPLSNFTGINGFEWNLEDPKNPNAVELMRSRAMGSFQGLRHYLDWEKIEHTEGNYTFNPSKSGGWNYDTMYQWCRSAGMEVLVCFKNAPPWMVDHYPSDIRDNEVKPIQFGEDPADPVSYTEMGRAAFAFCARYGTNKDFSSLPAGTIRVDSTPRWTSDVPNKVRTGLGLIKYIECSNEPDKWWKGRKCYQTAREYAANLSAFYDGHKGKLGPGVGVKNADPNMQVVMAGLANTSADYLKGIIDWCKEFRGLRPDGSVDLPFDVINYHYYSCEYAPAHQAGNQAGTGVCPEFSKSEQIARRFLETAHIYAADMPVWVTESGYDLNQGSPVRALPIGNKTPEITEADWNLRAALLYARLGIGKLFFYELYDDNGSSQRYGTCGLINENKSRRASAAYIYQLGRYFGAYSYVSSLSTNPQVDVYTNGADTMYALYIADQQGSTANYSLPLPGHTQAYTYQPAPQSDGMKMEHLSPIQGRLEIAVSETPEFVTTREITAR